MTHGASATALHASSLKRKLLFVAPSAYRLGGLATWLDYLAPALQEKGWDVVVALVAGRYHDVETYLAEHRLDRTVSVRNPTGSREGRIRNLLRVLTEQRPDLVVSVNIPDVYPAVARMRTHSDGGPSVAMSLHGIQPDLYEDARAASGSLDAVVGTNRLACRLTETDARVSPRRIFYAPYGVDVPSGEPEIKEDRSFLRIAYAGRLEQSQKRVHDLVEITAWLDARAVRYELLIAGSGPEEARLRARWASSGALERVRFLGNCSFSELADKVYRQADVLLVTSLWETGPIVIWEAMAHGVPVVTSRYVGCGLEGSLEDGVNCLMYRVGDIAGAGECLLEVLEPRVRHRLAAEGRELIERRYSRQHSVDCWHKCLVEIADLPRRSPAPHRPVPPAGHLDAWLGVQAAEHIRRLVGRSFVHSSASEWPHSYGMRGLGDPSFWQMAAEIDGLSLTERPRSG